MLKRDRKIKLGFRNIIFNGKLKLVVEKCEKSKTCAREVKVELKKVQMGVNWRKKGETWAELRESRLSCR